MAKLQELREQAATKLAAMKQQRDQFQERKKAGKTGAELWPDQTRQAWDQVNSEYDALLAQIDDEKRADEVESRLAEAERRAVSEADRRTAGGHPGQEDFTPELAAGRGVLDAEGKRFSSAGEFAETRDLAFQAWAGRRCGRNRSERHVAAAKRFGIDPSAGELVINLADTSGLRAAQGLYRRHHASLIEARELSGLTGSAGGVTIATSLVQSLEVNMLAVGGLLQVADTITTETGEEMSWPTADDTSNEGEMLGENRETAADEDPEFAAVKWAAYVFSSKIVKVPVTLLEDSAFNLAAELGRMLGERCGRSFNRKCTSGTGANQPKGVVTASTKGRETSSSTAITADDVIYLEHSVDPAYRTNAAGFMCHDAIVLQLRLLKNAVTGSYLWRDGLQDNRPDTLVGRALTLNQHMDSALAASNKTMLFGDFSRYKVRRVRQLVLRRLTERYAEYNQEGFVALLRGDGNLLEAGTSPIKHLLMKP